ncbi:thioredoxin-like 1-2, chloroplastic isoform X1 [Ipomoea triloba]|uniref:thioredoxin-like 1-2, chloroplastic isoform X1 n=1 Tax=Ipomoea triloba TaxID=35885 RepID=UPI00125E6523|nr:thioredoxin-like 1-2, chloroplastic isoform X1 [Ipomoea triloba]
MASSLKNRFSLSGSLLSSRAKGSSGVSLPFVAVQVADSRSKEFLGKPLNISDQIGFSSCNVRPLCVNAQASICVSRSLRWWEKTLQPNMIEIHSAQELVDTLANAGDRLVIVDFYSPGCGGCKALHPKICQLAETNQNAIFLKVNYEEHKPMCHSLHIHVLPFFRFYRGAEGRVCSFSCTIATIKKLKDALVKYGTERCCSSLGAAKGLEESELLALSSTVKVSRKSPVEESTVMDRIEDLVSSLGKAENMAGLSGELLAT